MKICKLHQLWVAASFTTMIVAASSTKRSAKVPSHMERSLTMDGKGCESIQWTVDKEARELTMAVLSVPGAEWVAVGISEFGGMKGADIAMIRMLRNGDEFDVDDLFSEEYEMPRHDVIQNVELLSASFDSKDRISAIVRRPLDSCDEDDLAVTPSKQSIVCASGSSNSEGQPIYHGDQRSKATVNLVVDEDLLIERHFQLDVAKNASATHLVESVVVAHGDPNTATSPFPVDFQMPNVALDSTKRTTYLCHFFEMPMDMNVVGIEAVWNNGTTIYDEPAPQWLHHQDLRYCPDIDLIDPAHLTGKPFDCEANIPPCETSLGHVQFGRVPMPASVHLPLKRNGTYVLLIHYDNPYQQKLQQDTSGIRVWIDAPKLPSSSSEGQTTIFRANMDSIAIPADPNQKLAERQFMISSEATRAVLPAEGIQIFASHMHMHYRGVRSVVKHIRDGIHISNVYEAKGYDFAQQTPKWELWKLLPGDALIVSCFWKPFPDREIVGSLSTEDEMCDFMVAHAPRVDGFNFGVGFMVEPDQPFLNSYMGTVDQGNSAETITYAQAQHAPDSRDFVPLGDHRKDLCDLAVRDDVDLFQVRWSSAEIPAQTYMIATIGLSILITMLLSRFVEFEDIRKKRNTVVYAVQLMFSLVALPIILYYLVDVWEPVQTIDAVDPKNYTLALGFIYAQPILYLMEVAYRIDVRLEVLFHHVLTSVIVMFLNWILIESLAFFVIFKLGLILTLMAVTEQPMYVALLLKNVGYGDRKWWPGLCQFAGWCFILTKLVIIAMAYLTMVQGHTGKDASWSIGSYSFREWNADNTVPFTSTALIVSMSIALAALFVAQVMVGYVLLALARRAKTKLDASLDSTEDGLTEKQLSGSSKLKVLYSSASSQKDGPTDEISITSGPDTNPDDV